MSGQQYVHIDKAKSLSKYLEDSLSPGPTNVHFLDVKDGDFGGSPDAAQFTSDFRLATEHVRSTMKDVSSGVKGIGTALWGLAHDLKTYDEDSANNSRAMSAWVATIQKPYDDPSHRGDHGHPDHG